MSLPNPSLQPDSPAEDNWAAVTTQFQRIANESITKIIKDTTGTPRLIFGRLPDGTYGLVISKDGVDVTTVFS